MVFIFEMDFIAKCLYLAISGHICLVNVDIWPSLVGECLYPAISGWLMLIYVD